MNRHSQRFNIFAASIALLPTALLLAGCSSGSSTAQPGSGNTSSTTGTTNPTSRVDTNTALRTATLGTYHSLGVTISAVFLLAFAPSRDARQGSAPLSRLSLFRAAHAPTRDAPLFNYDNGLNLYNSTSRNGQTFTYNFFTDSAGTQPAGTATLLLPTSTDTYPYTTSLQFNITGGNFPGTGSGSLTYLSASTISIAGKLHLNADASDSQVTLTMGKDANGNDTVSGNASIVTSSINVQLTNFTISENGNGETASAAMAIKPFNYTGSFVINSDSNGNNSTLAVTLASGASTFKASGVITDANGNAVQNPTLNLTYPNGTQQTIANPLTTPAK